MFILVSPDSLPMPQVLAHGKHYIFIIIITIIITTILSSPQVEWFTMCQALFLELTTLKGSIYCYQPGFSAFPNQYKWTRGQTRNSGKALLRLWRLQEGVKTSNRFPCTLSEQGASWFLIWGEGSGCVQGSGRRAGLRVLPTPLVVLCARGMRSTLLLLLTPFLLSALQKWLLGFLVFLYLFVHNLPQLQHAHSYFQSLIVSLYFVAQGDICPGASMAALQQRVPGPRPVSVPLLSPLYR